MKRKTLSSAEIFGQTIANPRSRARVGILAYEAAAKVWDRHQCNDRQVHQWAAGFVHGYLARKEERRGL